MNDVQATRGDDRSEESRLRNTLDQIRKILETAVCTEGCDKGVVVLSQDGPTHPETMEVEEICMTCDGCGWYEGGKCLQTTCEKCKGSGVIKTGRMRTYQVYDHQYFSPLGDALIAAWELTKPQEPQDKKNADATGR